MLHNAVQAQPLRRDAARTYLTLLSLVRRSTRVLTQTPIDCSADTACICNSVTFQQAATSCVMQVCSAPDTEAAVAYFNSLCSSAAPLAPGNTDTFEMTHNACGLTKVSPATVTPGGTVIFSYPTTSASGAETETSVEGPQKTITISTQPISNPPMPASSSTLSGSASASSPASSPSSSNAAAAPVRAANLVAGGIGALFAVFV